MVGLVKLLAVEQDLRLVAPRAAHVELGGDVVRGRAGQQRQCAIEIVTQVRQGEDLLPAQLRQWHRFVAHERDPARRDDQLFAEDRRGIEQDGQVETLADEDRDLQALHGEAGPAGFEGVGSRCRVDDLEAAVLAGRYHDAGAGKTHLGAGDGARIGA